MAADTIIGEGLVDSPYEELRKKLEIAEKQLIWLEAENNRLYDALLIARIELHD